MTFFKTEVKAAHIKACTRYGWNQHASLAGCDAHVLGLRTKKGTLEERDSSRMFLCIAGPEGGASGMITG
jgi:hypothetical protein